MAREKKKGGSKLDGERKREMGDAQEFLACEENCSGETLCDTTLDANIACQLLTDNS